MTQKIKNFELIDNTEQGRINEINIFNCETCNDLITWLGEYQQAKCYVRAHTGEPENTPEQAEAVWEVVTIFSQHFNTHFNTTK